ncbi:RdgB/HAM1 family non-canonical purine NTP pyrophosphatase [Chitiniphilus eburneus]|uniref:dITP/XTP pyrophosphatase n=1 Tax=Chitiniphilus eburneus TaxID=2571148 RepID=A0A4U0PUE6_9NEIS|nr:RdgB/HAM1 family non-canonical purine NTP pyrophosphatase [Chitiniphilus eburneus]TJZ72035.1 RdgB/HAM1 family non-canonical purine NTP pyrophosphatase [Chitiniphilus eburneus]
MTRKIVLASNNAGKLREFSKLFETLDIQIVPQGELGVGEADEPHDTFVENALAKARHAAAATGLPALADDSGICVAALSGAPGVYSARYAGEPKSDARNNEKLLAELAGQTDRRAWYYAALVLVRRVDDPQPIIADGICLGEVLHAPQGDGGFGYDPLFWLPEFGRTVAEISADEKARISHRGRALRALVAKLEETGL